MPDTFFNIGTNRDVLFRIIKIHNAVSTGKLPDISEAKRRKLNRKRSRVN